MNSHICAKRRGLVKIGEIGITRMKTEDVEVNVETFRIYPEQHISEEVPSYVNVSELNFIHIMNDIFCPLINIR